MIGLSRAMDSARRYVIPRESRIGSTTGLKHSWGQEHEALVLHGVLEYIRVEHALRDAGMVDLKNGNVAIRAAQDRKGSKSDIAASIGLSLSFLASPMISK